MTEVFFLDSTGMHYSGSLEHGCVHAHMLTSLDSARVSTISKGLGMNFTMIVFMPWPMGD